MPQKFLFEGLRKSSNWSLQKLNNVYHYPWAQGDISSANTANALDIVEEYSGGYSSLLNNIVAAWPLRNAPYIDYVNGNTLTATNSPVPVVGPQPATIPFAAGFNGTNQSLTASVGTSLNPTAGGWWCAVWFNSANFSSSNGFFSLSDGTHSYSCRSYSGDNFVASMWNGSSQVTVYPVVGISPNCWNMLYLEYNPTTGNFGISLNNGALSPTAGALGSFSSATFSLGAVIATYFLDGSGGPAFVGTGVALSNISGAIATLWNNGAGLLPSALTPAQIYNWGLVSAWGCQEATGQTRIDSIGTNNLVSNNGVTQTTGVAYNAVDFTSANSQYLQANYNSTFDFTTQMAAQLWVDNSTSTTEGYISKGVFSSNEWAILQIDGQIYVYLSSVSIYGRTPASSWGTGASKHVAFSYDGSQSGNTNRLKIWINGVLQTLSFAGTIPATITPTGSNKFYVGSLGGTNYPCQASCYSCSLFSQPLTQAQVTALFGPGYPTPGTVYPFTGIL